MTEEPVKLNPNKHHMKPTPPPYRMCTRCKYVYVSSKSECEVCNSASFGPWPEDELVQLWYEAIQLLNWRKVELLIIVATMYFESSVYHFLFLGNAWLDPELKTLGTNADVSMKNDMKIWKKLINLKSHKQTDDEFTRLFGISGKDMLMNVLGDKDGEYLWKRYLELRDQRNHIIHRGRRYTVTDDKGNLVWYQKQVGEQLEWCIKWIPRCWQVFAKLHNEYIQKAVWDKQEKRLIQ